MKVAYSQVIEDILFIKHMILCHIIFSWYLNSEECAAE